MYNSAHYHNNYSGNLLREKTFAFIAVSEPSAKVSSAEFCEIRNAHVALHVCGWVAHVLGPHLHMIGPKQSAKVISQTFSAIRYTVVLL